MMESPSCLRVRCTGVQSAKNILVEKINISSDSIEHVEAASRQKLMQHQVAIQLGDPTVLKASKVSTT